jgi:histidinol-phosphate aminotransferase
MSSSETLAGGINPRPVVGRLPRYAAGKPPVAVEGLASYKLSSNENPLPPLPAVVEAIARRSDFNSYPDPLCSWLSTALA